MTKLFVLAASIGFGVLGVSCQVCAQEQTRLEDAARASVAGDWVVRVVVEGTVYVAGVTFTQDGNAVGGTLRTEFGESALTGSLEGRTVRLTAVIEEVNLEMSGELDGSEIRNGTVVYGDSRGTWTGTRQS